MLDIFGMLGAIYTRWPEISEQTTKEMVLSKLNWIRIPKQEGDFILYDVIQLHTLRGCNFESRIGYSAMLDCLVMAE